ncbi:MAG: hypothetical protein CPSOU_4471 [uncultured Paraburkholderia sp.]|nr:MAG: hypothetical protein CPSOU_4471 [uncultured Paraburkholderia sp.]
MSLSLDHIVIRVQDLERTIADFSQLGFTVQRGDTHADGATHNALIVFADGNYVELIAFLRDAPEHRWWDAGNRAGDGFVDFALLPQTVAGTIAAARERGLAYDGPHAGGRVRADGERLEWQIGKPASADLPFLYADLTPRRLRVAEGEVRYHVNGVRGVARLTVAVNDLNASLARYRALLGEIDVESDTLADEGIAVASLALGPTTLRLASPANDAPASIEGTAAQLRRHLDSRGEGIFAVTLYTHAIGAVRPLASGLTHNANIELIADSAPRHLH